RKPSSVGRHLGRDRAAARSLILLNALASSHLDDPAGAKLEAAELLASLHDVGPARPRASRRGRHLKVQKLSIWRCRRPLGAAHVAADDLDALTAVAREHPDAGPAAAALHLLTMYIDVAAVRRPGGLEDADILVGEHR